MHQPLDVVMDVRELTKLFPAGGDNFLDVGRKRRFVHAVDNVSFTLRRGKILALVGESGSGKSTIARLLARLIPATSGQVLFDGKDILRIRGRRKILDYRSRVQMVFQDPFGSLNPVKSVAYHVEQPLRIHHQARGKTESKRQIYDLLSSVGLTPPGEVAERLPHQLSGGQQQRVSFARALAVSPEIILADEPISMLDVSIRMGVLNLMEQLRETRGLSYLYITHDIASARYLADSAIVLYAGQVMESAPTEELMSTPLHPYTQLLLSAVPDPSHGISKKRVDVRGEIPTIINSKPGCRFASRCPMVMDICRQQTPALMQVNPGHSVRCYLYGRESETTARNRTGKAHT